MILEPYAIKCNIIRGMKGTSDASGNAIIRTTEVREYWAKPASMISTDEFNGEILSMVSASSEIDAIFKFLELTDKK